MSEVRAKKHLGQHFLRNDQIALDIVDGLRAPAESFIIEIGPGDGVLSKFLLERYKRVLLFDVDDESIDYLKRQYPLHVDQIKKQDFLAFSFDEKCSIIGNFPYNISSQIVFKIIENRDLVEEMVGMFQKEVARRIASPPGSKEYGILSVLTQAYYEVEYLFSVDRMAFEPPPNVESGVIRLVRNGNVQLSCDEKKFVSLVKRSFNQRRKMIRKSLKDLIPANVPDEIEPYLTMRPEQLHYNDFIILTNALAPTK